MLSPVGTAGQLCRIHSIEDPPSSAEARAARYIPSSASNWTRRRAGTQSRSDNWRGRGALEAVDMKWPVPECQRGDGPRGRSLPPSDHGYQLRWIETLRSTSAPWTCSSATAIGPPGTSVHSVADIRVDAMATAHAESQARPFGKGTSLVRRLHYAEHGIGAYGRRNVRAGSRTGSAPILLGWPPFQPDGPNDLAPSGYNLRPVPGDRQTRRWPQAPHPAGFRWGTYDPRRTVREHVREEAV